MPKVTDTPGAAWNAERQKWFARVTIDGARTHLGYFDSAEDASTAYLAAKGKHAKPRAPKPSGLRAFNAPPPTDEPLAMSVLEALFSGTFLSIYGEQAEHHIDVMLLVITASRLEGVFPFVASEAYLARDMETYESPTVDILRQRIQLLRKRGLLDRVSEVVDRALRGGDLVSFEQAVAEVSAGDLC